MCVWTQSVSAAESRANGFALFTAPAADALGLDVDALQLRAGAEDIEHLGRVDTFTMDLEARWQDESTMRRLAIADIDLAFDMEATFAADPSVIWAHLTSPALRTRWEGFSGGDGVRAEVASFFRRLAEEAPS